MVRPLLGGMPARGNSNAMVTPGDYERLLRALQLPDRILPLTPFERVSPNEASLINRMARLAASTVIENYCDARQVDVCADAMRDQHAKAHGCLCATFVVRDDVPPALAVGVFERGKCYKAIIRFSNAQGVRQSDRSPDGRGMAIKLLDVPGNGMLSSSAEVTSTQQDFLLTNYPVFFGKNVEDYTEFLEIVALPHATWRASLKRVARLVRFYLPRLRQLWIFLCTAFQHVESPLRATYHSMTPYLLGQDTVVRYVAIPRQAPEPDATAWRVPGPNFLRRALIAEVRPRTPAPVGEASFDFCVQLRHGARPEDVEDASRLWRGRDDARIPLARIQIPLQDFDTAARWHRAETLSFNPWHCLPQHRPLGGLNRMRLAVYCASLEVRRRLNMIPT
jgi:hypothetical protein